MYAGSEGRPHWESREDAYFLGDLVIAALLFCRRAHGLSLLHSAPITVVGSQNEPVAAH